MGAFAGLQPPYEDSFASSMLIGMRPETRKEHIVRAIAEGLVFNLDTIAKLMTTETGLDFNKLKFLSLLRSPSYPFFSLRASISEHFCKLDLHWPLR